MSKSFSVNQSGTYILLLYNKQGCRLSIGKLGEFQFRRGYYLYVGSAFAPGGLAARVGRHLSDNKSLRWHIDYLTSVLPVKEVWFSTASQKLECMWSKRLENIEGATTPMKGLGSSDCDCYSHLHYFAKRPKLESFQALARDKPERFLP